MNNFTVYPSQDSKWKQRKYKSRRLPPHYYVVLERVIGLIYISRIEIRVPSRTTLTNQNCIQEEIKSRLKLWNACYHSVQNLLSSSLLSKNMQIEIYRNIILPVVLYGCETWSLTLKEEGRLRVFENRVLRRIFEPKRNEVTGEWRKLHKDELNDLYCSINIVRVIKSRRMKWAGHVARIGRVEVYTGFWWGKPEGKKPLRKPGRRWEDNIKMDLQMVGCEGMDWIDVVQDRGSGGHL